jgi:hypothetical protein
VEFDPAGIQPLPEFADPFCSVKDCDPGWDPDSLPVPECALPKLSWPATVTGLTPEWRSAR